MHTALGKICTYGNSYRARAEARQREYRSQVLELEPGRYGHFLTREAADAGANFVLPEVFTMAKARRVAGKGVSQRTFENMLSSQAMCFNLFAPLASDIQLAARILRRILPLSTISELFIEYTPDSSVFADQSGQSGVDCDVLIVGVDNDGQSTVIALETKFVEPKFSICGFRKAGRLRKGKEVCPPDIPVADDTSRCLYETRKGYLFWQRTYQHRLLASGALEPIGCPFGGPLWQLWVNRALAAEEGARRNAKTSALAICAPSDNLKLLNSNVLEEFRQLLSEPDALYFVDLETMIEAIAAESTHCAEWASKLHDRYGGI